MARQRIGARRHFADIKQHNGNFGDDGQPTYQNPDDWNVVIDGWPCELITTGGGEVIRGRQVTAQTSHVMIGEHFGGDGIKPEMRAEIDEVIYSIVAAYDPDGDRRETRVEAKIER